MFVLFCKAAAVGHIFTQYNSNCQLYCGSRCVMAPIKKYTVDCFAKRLASNQ